MNFLSKAIFSIHSTFDSNNRQCDITLVI